jgi:transposase
MRALLDGVLYVLRTGCAWRHLPLDFPPWQTTLRWFLRLARTGVFERMAHTLAVADRERAGRGASPTAAVVDAQAVRSGGTGVAGRRGYDAAKRVVGRKRHALVDTDGRLLLAAVSPADLHDSHGGMALLRISRCPWPFLALCYADRAYAGSRVADATPVRVELVSPKPGQCGFAVQSRRWVIERTFGWTGRCRRLARDHEATHSSATAFFVLAAANVLLSRLAKPL